MSQSQGKAAAPPWARQHLDGCLWTEVGNASCTCHEIGTIQRGPIGGRCPDNDKRCHCEAGEGCPLDRSHAVGTGFDRDDAAVNHALVMAHMLLRRIRDKTGTVSFYEANAVLGMIDALLPKSLAVSNPVHSQVSKQEPTP